MENTKPRSPELDSLRALDDFLYAPILEDQDGMTLSVLSAIARQDIDPWAEAARLAQLPKDTAIKQIVALLNTLPRRTAACLDSAEVAARLSVLLPRGPQGVVPGLRRSPAATSRAPTIYSVNWRFFLIYLSLMLLMNWLIAQNRVPSTAAALSRSASRDAGASSRAGARPTSVP